MSKGVYTILSSYTGDSDKYLSARLLLNKRLNSIRQINDFKKIHDKTLDTNYDPRPTLEDISLTHNFAAVSTFKPHVAIAYEYFKTSKDGLGVIKLSDKSTDIRFDLASNEGHWLNDMVLRIQFQDIGIQSNAPDDALRYRYCDLPGMRLLEKVAFNVDGVDVADYNTDDITFNDFHIQASKRLGYLRSMGREDVLPGEFYLVNQQVKQVLGFKNGAQTLKFYQPKLELWIPLLFWFNKDVHQSLQNIRIRTVQKYINIKLAPLNKIIQAVDKNNKIIDDAIISFKIEGIELYTKNIFVNHEVSELFNNRVALSLIRINKSHSQILDTEEGNVHLNQLKYAIEYLKFGFKPLENENGDLSFDNWHKFAKIKINEVPHITVINNPFIQPVQQVVVRTINFTDSTPVVDKVGFKAFGNIIYPQIATAFYNRHLPLINPDLVSPEDIGKMIATFNLLPGNTEITGHLGTSKAREFYLTYSAQGKIDSHNKVRLYVAAESIAFLYYDTNTIYLKYIT